MLSRHFECVLGFPRRQRAQVSLVKWIHIRVSILEDTGGMFTWNRSLVIYICITHTYIYHRLYSPGVDRF